MKGWAMKTILVLEDDENLRELLVDVLDSLDYRVEGAEGPEVALHLAEEIVFDLVISDVRMAGPVDGLGVLERLKNRRPKLRCIVITGYADELAPVRAMQIRVDDYLYKPFNVQDVVAAMQRVQKSGQQNLWYRKILARLMDQPDNQQMLGEMQELREDSLKSFFVAVRSNLLYAETALSAWDQLEELELSYLSAMRSPASLTPEAIRALSSGYLSWQSRLSQRVSNQELVMAPARSPDKVDRPHFKSFLERIREGRISAEDLGMAVCLRRMPAPRREQEPEYQELWQRLWG